MRNRWAAAIPIAFAVALACSAHVRGPGVPPAFPALSEWKASLPDAIVGGLATDGARVFVATRDGGVRALAAETGETSWGGGGRSGVLSAGEGVVVVRGPQGTLWGLEAATGAPLWTVETGVAGALPAAILGGVAYVGGEGLAAVDLRSGKLAWSAPAGVRITAPLLATPGGLLTGEADGALRYRALAGGAASWSFATKRALLAAPVIAGDEALLGTTDGRFTSVRLRDGKLSWSWRIGADLQFAPALFEKHVLFATHEAVVYSLATGGNMAWRAALPSRPMSPPTFFRGAAIVAVYENDLIAFDARTGVRVGAAKTTAQIQTAPLVVGERLFVGLKGQKGTLLSLRLALVAPSPSPSPSGSPSPDASPGADASPGPDASPSAPAPAVATPVPLPAPSDTPESPGEVR